MVPALAKAHEIHGRIVANAGIAGEALLAVANDLRAMRDGKLYRELGHETFEDYTVKAVGITPQHARRFIKALEVVDSQANGTSMFHLGVSKLAMIAQLPEPEREAFITEPQPIPSTGETKPVADMTTRELAEAVKARKEAERRAAEAERIAREAQVALRNERERKPEVEVREVEVQVADPMQQAEIARLERELEQTSSRYNQILAKIDSERRAEAELQETRKKLAATVERMQRIGVQFDDSGRDQNGGLKLLETIDPIRQAIPKALGDVLVLKRTGVGGWCEDEQVADLTKRLRNLADALDEILRDRRTRPITQTEVR